MVGVVGFNNRGYRVYSNVHLLMLIFQTPASLYQRESLFQINRYSKDLFSQLTMLYGVEYTWKSSS
jgi:hypothetical protein